MHIKCSIETTPLSSLLNLINAIFSIEPQVISFVLPWGELACQFSTLSNFLGTLGD